MPARPPRPKDARPDLQALCLTILEQQEALAECLAWRERDSKDVGDVIVRMPLHDFTADAAHAPTPDVAIILRHLGTRMHDLENDLTSLGLARTSLDALEVVLPKRGARVFVPTTIDDAWRRTKVAAVTLVEAYGTSNQLQRLQAVRQRKPVGEGQAVVPDAPASPKPTQRQPRAAVLIVDDEPDILDSLATYIAGALPELHVLTASSGQAALDVMAEQPVALILSDIRMPGMDGATFLEKAERLQPGVRRLLITAYPVVGDRERGVAEAVLQKPVSLTDLIDRLKSATSPPAA